jgi:hypothetical protein
LTAKMAKAEGSRESKAVSTAEAAKVARAVKAARAVPDYVTPGS